MEIKKFKNVLLVCDMDGTLLDSENKISNENTLALKYFVENGGLLTVATGRMESSVQKYLDFFPVNMPGIFYNGALISDLKSNEVLWSDPLPEDIKKTLQDILLRFPELGIQILSCGDVYTFNPNDMTEIMRKREGFKPIYPDNIQCIPEPWYKILIAGDNNKLLEINEYLSKYNDRYRTVFSESRLLDILSLNVSKGRALKELVEKLGNKEIMLVSVGDNMNDYEMFEVSHIGIAVDNAHPNLKSIADYCCCHHNESPIREIINIIETIKKT